MSVGEDHLPLRFLARHLDLTETQKEEAKALGEAFREEVRPIHQEIRTTHGELRALLDTTSPDATQVGLLTLEIDAGRDRIRALGDELLVDFQALLTPEQMERFEAAQERWENRKEERRERFGERGKRGGRHGERGDSAGSDA